MLKLIVHNLTLLTFLVHAVLGCCAHHVHATLTEHQTASAGHSSDASAPIHTCHRHQAKNQNSHSDESNRPTDESDSCEQTACVYVDDDSGTKIQQNCADWKYAAFSSSASDGVHANYSFASHVGVSDQFATGLSALLTRAALQSWQV